ncbi:MAG: TetR/AcrR family transcriptional regulator [Caulobacter sp.]|nr:TetR/AcrR family transcriptional regulator [Caulobacter sp.]
MTPGQPKWRRRKEARPAEIVAAALEVFAGKGFAAARLDDIAAAAGVSKGALYLYFETKQDLFTAVVRTAITPNIAEIEAAALAMDMPFARVLRLLVGRGADVLSTSAIGGVAKMVIAESRNFPDLARVWHDEVANRVLSAIVALVEKGQAAGEVRPGDPRGYAFSIISPLLMGLLWREVFVPIGAAPMNIRALAEHHIEAVLDGLLTEGARA